ncbi:hypothetical protein D9M68_973010 [compost metagenome]
MLAFHVGGEVLVAAVVHQHLADVRRAEGGGQGVVEDIRHPHFLRFGQGVAGAAAEVPALGL